MLKGPTGGGLSRHRSLIVATAGIHPAIRRRRSRAYASSSEGEGRKSMRGIGRVFKRGPVYWIAYYHRGKEYRESSESENENQARKLLKQRLGETSRGHL